jgi:hypothetical protein
MDPAQNHAVLSAVFGLMLTVGSCIWDSVVFGKPLFLVQCLGKEGVWGIPSPTIVVVRRQ